MNEVNVRALPSTKSSLVRRINSRKSEVSVNSEILNSAGETWYGVKLYSGHVGYIRGDLLDVEIEQVKKDTVGTDTVGAGEQAAAVGTAGQAAAAGTAAPAAGQTAASTLVVCVVTVPEGTEAFAAKDNGFVIHLTAEEAEKLGLLTFAPAEKTENDSGYTDDPEHADEMTEEDQSING